MIQNKLTLFFVTDGPLGLECLRHLSPNQISITGAFVTNERAHELLKQTTLPLFSSIQTLPDLSSVDYILSACHRFSPVIEELKQYNKPIIEYCEASTPNWIIPPISHAILKQNSHYYITWIIRKQKSIMILQKHAIHIKPDETAQSLIQKTIYKASQALPTLFEKLLLNKITPLEHIIYSPKPVDYINSLISWNQPSEDIERLCRALNYGFFINHLACAKFIFKNQAYTPIQVTLCDKKSNEIPGTIVAIKKKYIQISTLTNDLRLYFLKTFNGILLNAENFSTSVDLKVGDILPSLKEKDLQLIKKIELDYNSSEQHWSHALQLFTPTRCPYFETKDKLNHPPITIKTAISEKQLTNLKHFYDEKIETLILTFFLIYLYRLDENNELFIALQSDYKKKSGLFNILYSDCIPTKFHIEETDLFKSLLIRTKVTLEKNSKLTPYKKDIFLRYPELSSGLKDWPANTTPIIIQITKNLKKLPTRKDTCLVINIEEKTGCYAISYNTNLLKKQEKLFILEKIPGHLAQLIESIILEPNRNIWTLPILTEQEKEIIIKNLNNTKMEYPRNKPIHKLFEEQVDLTPDKTALIFNDHELTYSHLNRKANQLAHYLMEQGVLKNTLVGICVTRGFKMVISMIAILKTGAAYLPIEVDYPEERIKYMLNDSSIKFCITENSKNISELLYKTSVKEIIFSEKTIKYKEQNNPLINVESSSLVYVIYTSGSTGEPKGVIITHKSLVNLICSFHHLLKEKNREYYFLSISSYSFDIAEAELFLPLTHGGKVLILSKKEINNLNKIKYYLEKEKITHLQTTPSNWQGLTKVLNKNLKLTIICTGEQCPVSLLKKLYKITNKIWNFYGPTETTIWSLACNLHFNKNKKSLFAPIGKALSNTSIYIVDKKNNIKPIGAIGELLIGGDGLAVGYINKPTITNEKFITLSFHPHKERLYKTGDLVRVLPNGDIDCIGRKDNQIKIRGYRIELGEIEANILKFPSVKECVVVLMQENQKKYLVAYITIDGIKHSFHTQALRHFLEEKIPGYMIPNAFVLLDKIPLTNNLKVNKDALSQQKTYSPEPNKVTIPRNELEKKLILFYADAFNIDFKEMSINEDFFSLGGDSIIAMQIIARCNQEGFPLTIKDLFTKSSIQAIADYLIQEKNLHIEPNIPLHHEDHSNVPLAPVQNRLYILAEQEPDSPFYNIPVAYRLRGNINPKILEASLSHIIKRHDVLRSYVSIHNDSPKLEFIDINQISPILSIEKIVQKDLEERVSTLIHEPFNLKKPPLFRFHLLLLDDNQSILIINMHHIITDGWSIDIFNRELTKIYNAFIEKKKPKISEISLQYSDFSVWQTKYISKEKTNDQLTYWKTCLKDVKPLNLPLDYPRPTKQDFQGRNLYFKIDKTLTHKLKTLAQEKRTTLFNLIYTALLVLLYRYTGQEDITIGTPTASRPHPKLEGLMGFFSNTLVLRGHLENKKTFLELLLDNQNKLIDAFLNQDVPFEQVVSAVNPKRVQNINPLFQILLGVEPQTQSHPILGNAIVEPYPLDFQYSDFDISLYLENTTDNELSGKLQFSTNLFKLSKMERFITHLKNVLFSITENPEIDFRNFYLLSQEEKKLIDESNETTIIYKKEKSIVDILNLTSPDLSKQIAIVTKNQSYTYEEIHDKSNLLAHYIQTFQLPENSLIAILTEKSIETVLCILAVLKTGHAYLPIDPSYPIDRINYMLHDSQAQLVLTKKNLLSSVPNSFLSEKIIFLETINNQENLTPMLPELNLENLAYVIYTSGSTGKPKGVMIPTKALINFIYAFKFLFSKNDYLLSLTTHSFDIFGLELFLPLSMGAKIYISSSQEAKDPTSIAAILEKENITVIQATPTSWKMLMQSNLNFPKNLTILTGGEKLQAKLAEQLLAQSNRVFNLYGPTETTIWSSYYPLKSTDSAILHIPIGKPIANTQIYILDNHHQQLPVGIPGEIYIGGTGVANGYLNQPALTQERFIDNPSNPTQKLYKTGDIGYFQEDGNICYVERNDNQIKLYGHRIELDEIDSQILSLDNIKESVSILPKKNDSIITFYVTRSKTEVSPTEIKSYLLEKLPNYMLPSIFICIEKIPLTSNKKIDRKALEEIYSKNKNATPINSKDLDLLEKTLHHIWSNILGLQTISLNANFFDLGGNSIRAIELIHTINNELDLNLKISDLFQYNTITLLKNFIQNHDKQDTSKNSIIILNKEGNKTPLFLFHPIGGTLFCYLPLVKHLEKDRPIYGIQDPAIFSKEQLFNSVEEMASNYIDFIKTIQPTGPYLLSGVSMGGTLSVEIAKQLLEKTKEMAYPILIDTWGMMPKKYLSKEDFKQTSLRQKEMVRNKIMMNSKIDPAPWIDLNWQRLNMLLAYQSPIFKTPTLLIKAQELLPEFAEIDSPSNHLGSYLKNLKIIPTPGSHETIVLEENAKIIASIMVKYIQGLNIDMLK